MIFLRFHAVLARRDREKARSDDGTRIGWNEDSGCRVRRLEGRNYGALDGRRATRFGGGAGRGESGVATLCEVEDCGLRTNWTGELAAHSGGRRNHRGIAEAG